MSETQNLDDIVVEEQNAPDFSKIVNYNPLGDNVEEKDYQRANIAGANRLPEIEEPSFQPPTLEDIRPEMFGGGGEDEDEIFGKEAINDLPKGDKKKAAKQLTDMVLEGYSGICQFAGGFANMKEDQLFKMASDGKIDLQMAVPVSPQESVGVVDFVDSFNTQINEAMEVTDEFKDSVREPMTRIFSKKGVGMTDEQFLLVMFGKDIVTKTATTIALKRQLTATLEIVHDQYKQAGSPPPPRPAQAPPAPQPQAQNPKREEAKKKKSKKAQIVAPND